MRDTIFYPDVETLAGYAAGTLPQGMSLLVAAHLTYSPKSRDIVANMECAGAAAFDESPAEDLGAEAFNKTLQLIDEAPNACSVSPAQKTTYDDASILPRILQEHLTAPLDNLPWQFCLPGLHKYSLEGFEGEEVALIRARPGAQMLPHTHTGDEATLILSGKMQDGDTVYQAGDVAQADHDDDHRPCIVGDETCYCLIVMSGGMQFTGRFSRALNILNRVN